MLDHELLRVHRIGEDNRDILLDGFNGPVTEIRNQRVDRQIVFRDLRFTLITLGLVPGSFLTEHLDAFRLGPLMFGCGGLPLGLQGFLLAFPFRVGVRVGALGRCKKCRMPLLPAEEPSRRWRNLKHWLIRLRNHDRHRDRMVEVGPVERWVLSRSSE